MLNQHCDLTVATDLRQRLRKCVKEAKQLKEEANQAFKLGELEEALKLYTDALEVCLGLPSLRLTSAKLIRFLSTSAKTRTKEKAASFLRRHYLTAPQPW